MNRSTVLFCRIFQNRLQSTFNVSLRTNSPSLSTVSDAQVNSEDDPEKEVDTSELDRIRNKSRMADNIRKELFDLDPIKLKLDRQYRMKSLRKRYAKYGNASGLNPGICYPTREEVKSMIEYENLAHPDLMMSLASAKQKREAEEEYRRNREEEILKNMAMLPKWKKEMLDREAKKQKEIDVHTAKKERLIEEVQEYLGYQVDPKDPKFQEMLEQKEQEIKKATKVAQKKEKHEKMLAQLLSVGEGLQKSAEKKQESTADVLKSAETKPAPASDEKENKE